MGNYIINFEDAEREQLYAKIALAGASGSGKTVSALKLALGLADGDWQKIAVADTENKRALAYRGTTHTGIEVGKFKHAPIAAPYDSEKFAAIIDTAIAIGAEVLIIDSMSHQWEGLGGVRHEAEEGGGAFWDWKGPKKKHQALKDKIQQAAIHIIVTLRTKQEYAVIPGGGNNGKNGVQKLGMKPVQEDNFDYEFLSVFHLDEDNFAKATKDNTGLFKGETVRLEQEHGIMLRDWLVEGKAVKSVAEEKAEQEARKQELLEYIDVVRVKNEAWFTNKEIQNGKFETWPLDSLEKLYVKLSTPKEEKPDNQEEAPQADDERQAAYAEIQDIGTSVEGVSAMVSEYVSKLKKESIHDLTDAQLKTLLGMCQRKQKTAEKEKVTT